MLQSLNTAASTATAGPTAGIGVPVAHSIWPNALAAQLQWMATRQVQSATLRLSPEHLGPLEVRIDVTRSQINVNFTAHHPDTREALAQAVPHLRQLFAAGGLNLGEATVQQEPRSSEQSLLPQPSNATSTSETVEPVANAATHRLGLVDEYA
jgi:flagellar hook-length control protein FliK